MQIALEGRLPTALLVLAGLGLGMVVDWRAGWALWVLALLTVFLFRQPARAVESSPLSVLCPVDGRIETVGEARDPVLERRVPCIELRQSALGPYVIRAPTEGKLMRLRSGPGAVAMLICTDEGDELTLEVADAPLLRYLHCQVAAGERMRQGGVCGFAGFARRVRIYLPPGSQVEIEAGNGVRAGQPLARLIRTPP